jgi:hypothetical protein
VTAGSESKQRRVGIVISEHSNLDGVLIFKRACELGSGGHRFRSA